MDHAMTYGRYTVPKHGYVPWTAEELREMRIADAHINASANTPAPEYTEHIKERKADYYQRNREQIRAQQNAKRQTK